MTSMFRMTVAALAVSMLMNLQTWRAIHNHPSQASSNTVNHVMGYDQNHKNWPPEVLTEIATLRQQLKDANMRIEVLTSLFGAEPTSESACPREEPPPTQPIKLTAAALADKSCPAAKLKKERDEMEQRLRLVKRELVNVKEAAAAGGCQYWLALERSKFQERMSMLLTYTMKLYAGIMKCLEAPTKQTRSAAELMMNEINDINPTNQSMSSPTTPRPPNPCLMGEMAPVPNSAD
ncbi:hypothetical protein CYMTET_23233 [Cymbomonas tetramitiformis]|uniref:Uncharacterized protein n=1 Tax=Cymbomonas tetramitiformis TaxID=36881 RepID=A0AAE0FZT2_9CHLO|nr:hypothetical protein CYMTET_23233 [Cymbomonas tetramitiformis]